ncbi:MAG: DEAD/DEAH box helicase [Verrucomicrobia bacterium]|nr:DEAD/DEAH box helicase [Verrucomicrobiota bacterium]
MIDSGVADLKRMEEKGITENFLARIGGWEVMKRARVIVASGQALSSNWSPPVLKGAVREGTTTYRAGLVVNGEIDIDNICSCRQSRGAGMICAHSVAVGLHHIQRRLAEESAGDEQRAGHVQQANAKTPAGRERRGLRQGSGGKTISRVASAEGGEPLQINVILPPNLSDALSRGRIMVVFEAKWAAGRRPLNTLPGDMTFGLDDADIRLFDFIDTLSGGETPAMVQLGLFDFCSLLENLSGHPRVTVGKSRKMEICNKPWTPPLRLRLESNGEITAVVEAAGGRMRVFHAEKTWVLRDGVIQRCALPHFSGDNLETKIRISRERVPAFLSEISMLPSEHIRADFNIADFKCETAAPDVCLHLSGGLAILEAVVRFKYGSTMFAAVDEEGGEQGWIPDARNPYKYIARDTALERRAVARLVRAGFSAPDERGRLVLHGQDTVLNFFARELPALKKHWDVSFEERFEARFNRKVEYVEPKVNVSASGENWFDLSVDFGVSGGDNFSFADAQKLLVTGKGYKRLSDGRTLLFDTTAIAELEETLRDCAPKQHSGVYKVSAAQAGFLNSTVSEHPEWKLNAPAGWLEKAGHPSAIRDTSTFDYHGLAEVLRGYQKQGVVWLEFLRNNGFGGVLADEMGLGKTLQVLAFLNAIAGASSTSNDSERCDDRRPPSLVVCPTSLVFNWAAEAERFTPRLRVLILHGPGRRPKFDLIKDHDLIITSYALVRRDLARYKEHEFDLLVLDEAQHIKNRQTQNSQSVKAIKANQRVVLTGTPLENSVLDIWSIFDFLMPGYLGSARDFSERYETPITREDHPETKSRLARRVRPFILRRLKRDVASELPDKIEQTLFCEMNGEQAAVYDAVLKAARSEIVNAAGDTGRSRMMVFTALLRLRQICCDLRLLKDSGLEFKKASGKLELFRELIEEVIDGGHRVIVFSQFVQMLRLLENELAVMELDYCYMDGQTKDRERVVNEFQNNSRIPVFLLSLKAGGVGLNLSAADTIIHFDPWWNPAVENQATDRAHRIGQERVVTSYKVITRNSVEEKILKLQEKKKALISGALGDEESLASSLSWQEIQELLSE